MLRGKNLCESDQNKGEDIMMIDNKMDGALCHLSLIQRKILNNKYPRLLIINKYSPKYVGGKTCILSLYPLEVVNIILSFEY